MTLSIADLYDKALGLSFDVDDNFLDLGRALRRLLHRDPGLFQQIVNKSHLGRRKAYYLVEVSRIFDPLPIPRSRLRKIGWTKLQLIGKHINPDNMEDLLQLAESLSAERLERAMRGEETAEGTRCVLMYFTPKQYAEFKHALVMNGAMESGRGLVDKEKALINALRKSEPGLEMVQPTEEDTPQKPPEESK